MASEGPRRYMLASAFALAFGVHVALFSVLTGRMPAASLALAGAAGAFVVAVASAPRAYRSVRSLGSRSLVKNGLTGILGCWGAVLLVAASRFTDAPSGSETVFFTGPVWAAIAVAVAAVALFRRGHRWASAGLGAGALAALAGGAGVLANWERPSSFSPLIRFPAQEMWMIAGGVLFVGAAWMLRTSTRDESTAGASLLIATGSALAAALLAWLVSSQIGATVAGIDEYGTTLAVWAVVFGATFVMLPRAMEVSGPGISGAGMFLAPVLISLLTGVEQMVGAAGPQPLLLGAVAGASVLVISGVIRVGASEGETTVSVAGGSRMSRALMWIAGLSLVLALAGTLLPAMEAIIRAQSGGPVTVIAWTMPGAETMAAWVAVSLAMLALIAARDGRVLPALLSLAAVAAYPLLLDTPTHVLTTWVPPEMQADFGTEYSSIAFVARVNWVSRAAVFGAVVVLAVVCVRGAYALLRKEDTVASVEAENGES